MSNLLSQASLVMIPSGYKEDVVYSQIPTDGSGDLSFTRASNGTRVNSAGLVEVCPWNAIQYSEDFANAIWSIPNGGSSVVVTTNATTAPNGTNTADKIEIANGTNDRIEQVSTAPILTSGLPCTFSVYIKSISGTGKVGIRSGQSGASSVLSYTNEWQRLTWTFNALGTYEIPQFCNNTLVFGADSAPSFYAWGAQLNIGSTAKPYFPTTDRLNVPRLTYQNGGGGCPSLLLEKQSTNLVVQSNDMTTWTNGAGTMTKNATTSPDGTNNALSFDNTTDCSTFVAASNGVYSWSLYIKQGTSAAAAIDMSDGSTGDAYASFTFSSKTFSTSSSGSWSNLSTSYIECGNGWFRITLTATKNAGSSIGHKIIATGSGYTYVYGAQLEASSYATSYIPTTSSSATRVADACYKGSISSLIGSTEGVLFVDFIKPPTGTQRTKITRLSALLTDGGNSFVNSINLDLETNGNLRGNIVTGGTSQVDIQTAAYAAGTRIKMALAYKANDCVLYINGTQIGTDTSASIPVCTAYEIGSYETVSATQTNYINQAVIFPTRLTNAELASITTI